MFFWFFLRKGAVLFLAAEQCFVGLDNLVFAADRRRAVWCHAFTDTMAKEPSTFICDPEYAGQLKGAHTFLAGSHQMIGEHPFVQRDFRILHDGANCHGEGLVAFVAPMNARARAFASKLCDARRIGVSAMTTSDAIRPI